MKRFIACVLTGILIVFFIGCDKDNVTDSGTIQIVGTGGVVTKTVNLSAFHSITNIAMTSVKVTKGTPQQVVLKAQQNILDVITYEIDNGELTLDFEEGVTVSTSREIEAEITIAEINGVTSIGVGNFELTGARQNTLNINIIGAGNVEAYNLEVDTCYVTVTGAGNCRVRVNGLLEVIITGTGIVFYKGHPTIGISITGTGSVIDDNALVLLKNRRESS